MILLLSGFDPTGNAGILRDIRVCKIFNKKFYPVVTAFAFQTDKKYLGTHIPDTKYFENILRHINPKKITAVKIGMLGNERVVRFILKLLKKIKKFSPKTKIVWDPVFESSSKGPLISHKGRILAQKELIKWVDVVTPNIPEAKIMTAAKSNHHLCEKFFKLYQKSLYLKGGHLKSKSKDFFYDGINLKTLSAKKKNKKIRGTGCALSTSLACHLSSQKSLWQACRLTKKFMNDVFNGKINF